MPAGPRWRRYLRLLGIDIDVDDELRFHLEAKREELVARGMSPGDAWAEAARQFGDMAEMRDGVLNGIRLTAEQKEIASTRVLIVHGNDGMDEITTTTTTRISELRDGSVKSAQASMTRTARSASILLTP